MKEICNNIESRVHKSNLNEYMGNDKPVNNIKPLVSVSVITYQHVDYIEQCLQSILMQKTNFPLEVVIGEDGSTDGTREICIKYAEKFTDKIRLFLRERKDVIYWHGIPSGEFNALANMKAIRGKYVAFCEGDDYWTDPYKLQKQVDYMESNPGCMLCTHASIVINGKGEVIRIKRPNIGNKKITVEEAINRRNREATSSFLYKKPIIDLYTGSLSPPFTPYTDTAQYILCAYYGFIGYLDEFMSIYRRFSSSNAYSVMSKKDNKFKFYFIIRKIDMYEAFNQYTEGLYRSAISVRKIFYLKRLLKLSYNDYFLWLPDLMNTTNNLTFKYKIYAHYLIIVRHPFIILKKRIKKLLSKHKKRTKKTLYKFKNRTKRALRKYSESMNRALK
jgi:glycosyltransferase involved in cell wall biosynthesis